MQTHSARTAASSAWRRASSSPVLAQAASADIAAVDAARASCPAACRPEKESNPSNRRNAGTPPPRTERPRASTT
ncbi:hypothetical protein PTBPS01_21380 [Burkholderia pseudomallei]|nr:hypothetical protein PTBPS01_21380 [Burkholderia pseudomallei]ONA19800.1 hypothetical protein AQ878_06030 [Burkholderia pseudomallei]